MRKIVLTLAALAAVGFVVPMTTSAKAEDTKVVIKHRGEGRHMDRGHHYGWDRGRHRAGNMPTPRRSSSSSTAVATTTKSRFIG